MPYIKFYCFLNKKQDDTVHQKSSINLILPFFKDYIQSKCCSIRPLQDALSQYRWMNYLKIIRASTLTFILSARVDWNTHRDYSEIWTLTKSLENTIDSFQRRLLISNQRLYERTKFEPWSITIFNRRLTWFGLILRLGVESPAQQALKCFIKPAKKPVGRPKTTWVDTDIRSIKENSDIDLTQDLTTNIDRLKVVCSNRKNWHKAVGSMMLTKLTNMQWRCCVNPAF